MTKDPIDFDYIVIGSGFGGSVSALRLAEKGYSVAVVERGKRWRNEDFPETNWNLRRFLWAPTFLCFGIQALTFLRDTMILHGCGVGGGSLVYANTLLVPPDEIFEDPRWRSLGDWKADLAPHYAAARRMMGVTTARCQEQTDHLLREVAKDMGRVETYHATDVAVFFGEPGKTAPDPYFVLPVLVGLLMVGQQLMMPTTTTNPQMKYVMWAMPVMFAAFTFVLPSGLGLYLFVSIGLGITQQYFIRKSHDKNKDTKAAVAA